MVRNLLIINVVAFIASGALFSVQQFSLHDPRSQYFEPYQFLTHMFLHGGWGHLFSNMLSLFFFGPMLEHYWGSKRFLTFYLITGFGASLLYTGVRFYEISQMQDAVAAYMANPDPIDFKSILDKFGPGSGQVTEYLVDFNRNPENPTMIAQTKSIAQQLYEQMLNSPMLGASGAVFGILMAFGMLFPNTELFLLFFPFPIKAKYFVLMYGAYELYTGFNRVPGDNVAHFAHLGGMLFAYILLKYWERQRTDFY